MQQEWRWWSEESSSVLKTLLLTITLYNSSGASEKRKYISFQIHGCKLFMTWINTRTSPWHIQVNRMHLVLFPLPSSLLPSCKCRCSPTYTVQILTNTNYAPKTHTYFCLQDTRSQIPNTSATPAWSRSRCNCRRSPSGWTCPTCGFRTWVLFLSCWDS